jgi:hypothetical protein
MIYVEIGRLYDEKGKCKARENMKEIQEYQGKNPLIRENLQGQN